MKRHFLLITLGCLFAGSVLAQQPATREATVQPREVRTADLPAETPLSDHRCLRHTGSLITASRNQRERVRPSSTPMTPRCAPVAGRAYSREDLDRTGAVSVLEALRMLDPAVH